MELKETQNENLRTKKLRTIRRLDLFRGEVLDLVWQLDPAGANRGP
jgi:hypothetical protein